ncbi:MAG: hypothetical protein KGD64_08855 [Candidatus Heimdallarchaeota archaeon]|nr:hypothetical protein [Candidatus Heimdallarchaeota archaeon]
MNYELRKSDSLAAATGSFKQNLEEVNLRWNKHIVKLGDLGPQIIGGINESISKKNSDENKNIVKSSLAEFGKALGDMEKTNADMVDLMIEMEGLDFPLKSPKKILELCEEEENYYKRLQSIVSNLSKTFSFLDSEKTDRGLLINSLKSFEATFLDLQSMINRGLELTSYLEKELDKEHMKAKKYLGKV